MNAPLQNTPHLEIPDELHKRLEDASNRRGCDYQQEGVRRLEASFKPIVGIDGLSISSLTKWSQLLSIAVLLLTATEFLEYGQYGAVKIVVCVTSLLLILFRRDEMHSANVYALAGIALLFNPILPLHLAREYWVILDFAVAAYFAALLFLLGKIRIQFAH